MFHTIKYRIKNIRIQKKVALTTILLFLFLFFILYILFSNGMQTMLSDRESDNIKNQLQLAEEILRSSFDYLPDVTRDWAAWDNTYEFVKGNFDEFLEYNLNDYPYQIYSLDFITLLDWNGDIIYERFYQSEYDKNQNNTIDLTEIYVKLGPLTTATLKNLNKTGKTETDRVGMSGFIEVDNQLIYISSYPILRRDQTEPSVGSLLFGRIIHENELNYLKDNPQITFSIQNKRNSTLSGEQNRNLEKGNAVAVVSKNGELEAYKQSYDIFGANHLLLSLSSPRSLHKESAKFITTILVIIALCCAAILFAIIRLMGIIIVKPFSTLVNEVNRIDFESVHTLPAKKHGNVEFAILAEAINKMLFRIKADIDAIAERNEMLHYNANYDSLTGLRNWVNSCRVLDNEITAAQENLLLAGVYFIDMDRFKLVNNSLGHRAGDRFIVSIAERMKERLGQVAAVGRMSGDKFIIIAGGFHEQHEIHLYADDIMSLFEAPFIVNDREMILSASVGSCTYPNDAKDAETLLINAEIAMYHAKQLGGNLYCRYERELQKVLQRKVYIENKIRSVIAAGSTQFQSYFQPKALSETGEILSCEALIRWVTPNGIIKPDEFIPLAEETGLIVPLSKWMLKEACRCNKLFEEQGIYNTVSVNVSAQVLLHKDFINMVKEAALESQLDIKRLDIEITEATLINDMVKINSVLEALHDLGVTISIDDFGTGYSSLSYLKKLPVDRIKIDQSFIVGLNDNEEDKTIVNAIVAMAKGLHMIVTAEGVEDAMQYNYLKNIECEEIQGYFVSRPVPCDAYIDFCKNWCLV